MNGASDLMVQSFGDKGRHARATVGVAALARRRRGRGRRRCFEVVVMPKPMRAHRPG